MSGSLLQPGTVVEQDLHVRRHVASGGMGDVYEAWDDGLGRRVAVKVLRRSLHDDATTPTVRAIREGRATARIVHPAIVAVHRVGRVDGMPMLVMEWVDGPHLRAVLASGPPARDIALRWLAEIADAIEAAHAGGVLHCDLKPENVLLAGDREGGHRVKVVDFGLARGDRLPQQSAHLRHGTRAYLPPEAGTVAPGPALDLYALAVIACELLAGQRPAAGPSGPRLPAALPAEVVPVLARALDEVASRRPRSAAAFVEALAQAFEPELRSDSTPLETRSIWPRRGQTDAALEGEGSLEPRFSPPGGAEPPKTDERRGQICPTGQSLVASLGAGSAKPSPQDAALRSDAPATQVGSVQAALVQAALVQAPWPSLPPSALRHVLQAAFALHRRVDLATIQDALAPASLDSVVAELQRAGWLRQDAAGLVPHDPVLARRALDTLDPALRAALQVSLGAVWGALGTGDDRWADEVMIAAWLAAGRPDAAARRVAASARRSGSVRGRDRGLARAAALLEQGGTPSLRLEMLLERAGLAVAAGWHDAARDALVAARWLAAGMGLGADSLPALQMRAIDAALRGAVGDAAGAALRLASVSRHATAAAGLGDSRPAHALLALAVRTAAEAVSASLLAGTMTSPQSSARLDLLQGEIDRLDASDEGMGAFAACEMARALVAAASERAFAAAASLRRAVAWQLERGDLLAAASLLLLMAELLLPTDTRVAAQALDEAEALLDRVGQVGASASLALLRAKQRDLAGDALGAQRWAAVALARAEALELAVIAVQTADVLADLAAAMRDEPGAWQARQARSVWSKRLRAESPAR